MLAVAGVIALVRTDIRIYRYHHALTASDLAATAFSGIFSLVLLAVAVFNGGPAIRASRAILDGRLLAEFAVFMKRLMYQAL